MPGMFFWCAATNLYSWPSGLGVPHRRRVVLYSMSILVQLYTIRILFQIATKRPILTNITEKSLEKPPLLYINNLLNAHASSSQQAPSLTQPKVPRPSTTYLTLYTNLSATTNHPLTAHPSPQKETIYANRFSKTP